MEFTWLQIALQWAASITAFGSTLLRSWTKHHMFLSSCLGFGAGFLFTIYSYSTGQWGLLPLNVYTTIMAIRAMYVWRKEK